jgi:hypothetical protein
MRSAKAKRLEGMEKGLEDLDRTTRHAVSLSERNIGVIHTGRQNRVLFVFAKAIAHNMSILKIVESAIHAPRNASLLDHFSVAALGRTSIDALLMTLYLSHPKLTLTEWKLRRAILSLHDTTNRKRFLEKMTRANGGTDKSYLDGYEDAKSSLRATIARLAAELGYAEDRTAELQNGNLVYIDGSRGAAREAGWDINQFEADQAYFSPFIHAHPVSFLRADEHGVSFSEPSDYQKYLCNYVMAAVSIYTTTVNRRVAAFCKSESDDALGHIED